MTKGEELCNDALNATQAELTDLKKLVAAKTAYGALMQSQRDAAIDEAQANKPFLPWYVWTIIGAAGGVVFVKGMK